MFYDNNNQLLRLIDTSGWVLLGHYIHPTLQIKWCKVCCSCHLQELPGIVKGSCVGKAVGDIEGDVTEVDSLIVDCPQTISAKMERKYA